LSLTLGLKKSRPQKSRFAAAFCFFFAGSAPVTNGGLTNQAGLFA
jgi:hypothetical protein